MIKRQQNPTLRSNERIFCCYDADGAFIGWLVRDKKNPPVATARKYGVYKMVDHTVAQRDEHGHTVYPKTYYPKRELLRGG